MASSQEFVDYVIEQFEQELGVTSKKMFGEYGLFCGGKMFGYVCDDRFLMKMTEEGRAFAQDLPTAAPYPGAKPAIFVEEQLEDTAWISELVRVTVEALPTPRKRKKKGG